MNIFRAIRSNKVVFVEEEKIYKLLDMLEKRDKTLDVNIFQMLSQLGELSQTMYWSLHGDDVQISHKEVVKLSAMMGMLIKYIYPMIEQLDKLVDDMIFVSQKRNN